MDEATASPVVPDLSTEGGNPSEPGVPSEPVGNQGGANSIEVPKDTNPGSQSIFDWGDLDDAEFGEQLTFNSDVPPSKFKSSL